MNIGGLKISVTLTNNTEQLSILLCILLCRQMKIDTHDTSISKKKTRVKYEQILSNFYITKSCLNILSVYIGNQIIMSVTVNGKSRQQTNIRKVLILTLKIQINVGNLV